MEKIHLEMIDNPLTAGYNVRPTRSFAFVEQSLHVRETEGRLLSSGPPQEKNGGARG